MRRRIALTLLLAACGTDEERFPEQFAKDYCAELKACDEDAYFEVYREGTPQCRDETSTEVRAQAFVSDDRVCKWVQENGEECLEELAVATCDDVESPLWKQACISAWDCVTLVER